MLPAAVYGTEARLSRHVQLSPRSAGKAPVGDERDLLSHPLTVNQCSDAQHLAHAGTADRTFITNDQNLPRGIFAIADGIDAFFLILEHARVSFEHQLLEAGDLDDGTIRAEIALQNRHAAVRHYRRSGSENDLAVRRIRLAIFFCNH